MAKDSGKVIQFRPSGDGNDDAGTQAPRRQARRPERPSDHRSPFIRYGTIAILVLVVVAFVGGPLLGGLIQPNRAIFGSYNGQEIILEPGSYMARQVQRLADQGVDQNQNIQQQALTIYRQAFSETAFQFGIRDIAAQAGLGVSTDLVDEAVVAQFTQNGRFNEEAFANTDAATIAQLRDELTDQLIRNQVLTDYIVLTRGVEEEVAFVAAMGGPERQFDFVQYLLSEYPPGEILAYAVENPDPFRTIELSSITVTSSEADAAEVRNRAAGGEDFAELARTFSQDLFATEGGSAGRSYAYELEREVVGEEALESIFATPEGELTPLMERASGGWVFYRVDRGTQAPDTADPVVIEDIRSYLNTIERGRIEDYFVAQADQLRVAAAEGTFRDAAAEAGLRIRSTSWFPINFGNNQIFGTVTDSSGNDIGNAAQREEFFETAFQTPVGGVTRPVVLTNSVVVLSPTGERDLSDGGRQLAQLQFSNQVPRIAETEVQRAILDPDLIEDNFFQTFVEQVIGQGQ